jgi:hypothetical protein
VHATLVQRGAGVKSLTEGGLLAHWREGRISPEKVRNVFLAMSGRTLPPGARLAAHFGAVRVGQGAAGTAENLLGAEVTFTHKLEAVAAKLDVGFLLSEPAIASLDLRSQAKSLGPQAVADIPGTHPVFAL